MFGTSDGASTPGFENYDIIVQTTRLQNLFRVVRIHRSGQRTKRSRTTKISEPIQFITLSQKSKVLRKVTGNSWRELTPCNDVFCVDNNLWFDRSRMKKSVCYRYRNKTLLTRILSPAIMLTWMAVGRRSIIMDANAWIPTRSSHIYNTVSLRRFSSSTPDRDPLSKPQNIAIVGGGLAGLSTAYHLLQKSPDAKITIFDKDAPGCGGASAVAGGYVVLDILRVWIYQSRM